MTEPVSDFSKILELQEIKKAYEEIQERHSMELAEREKEIERLKEQLSERIGEVAGGSDLNQVTAENERLSKQMSLLKQEFGAKIERLNTRIRELSASGSSSPQPTDPTRKGFFRR